MRFLIEIIGKNEKGIIIFVSAKPNHTEAKFETAKTLKGQLNLDNR